MSKKNSGQYNGLSGTIGGLAVKGMIRDVEQAMMNGATISAAPSSQDEADLLEQVKEENRRSALKG